MRVNSIADTNYVSSTGKVQKNYSFKPKYLNNIGFDKVSFGRIGIPEKYQKTDVPINVDLETAKYVANSLSTSTSGHRATWMSEKLNPEIVKLITLGVAKYAKQEAVKKGYNEDEATVLIGGDTREATRSSLPKIAETLRKQGVNVIYLGKPAPTPLLALLAKEKNVDLAVLMTASHNPWKDGGYNLVTLEGAIAPASVTKQVAEYMIDIAKKGSYKEYVNEEACGRVAPFDPYNTYKNQLNDIKLVDFDNIKKSGVEIFYDGLQGAGPTVVPRLYNDFGIPIKEVKSSGQKGPNPIDENLTVLKDAVKNSDAKLKIGLATDGDADRFGVVDENGKFISPNDVILLVGYHLLKNKGKTGTVIRSQATSMQLDKLAENYGAESIVTPVGFKYIGKDIEELRANGKDILVAGEESGGLTVNGHIPEKDGIIATALIADLVAKERKPVSEILKDVKESLGVSYQINSFNKEFTDEAKKNEVMENIGNMWKNVTSKSGKTYFDETHEIDKDATIEADANNRKYREGGDGYKFVLKDGSTVLIRKSGTEPIIKCYIESTGKDSERAKENSQVLRIKAESMLKA